MTSTRTIRALYIFESSIDEVSKPLVQALGHLPKFWDVTPREREWIGAMFAAPRHQSSRTLLFEREIELDALDRAIELISEMCLRTSGRKVILSADSPIGVVTCTAAFGGAKQQVLQWSERQTIDVAEYDRRLAALDGLQASEDDGARIFAELAIDALENARVQGLGVDWHAVEARFMMCCDGVRAPSAVLATLLTHSPGTASPLRRSSLEREVASIQAPENRRVASSRDEIAP